MTTLHILLTLLVVLVLTACSATTRHATYAAGATDALQAVEQDLAAAQQQRALLQDTSAATPCMHLQYRNPVIDLIEIKGGLRGGVYTPTHYEWVVYHSGAWEVVDSAGLRQSPIPQYVPGCLPPAGVPRQTLER
jgi:hypothetical protein